MTLYVPDEQREENLKLQADAYVDLFHIALTNGTKLYLKTGDPVTWNGMDWEPLPLYFSGYEISSEGQASRPKLKVINPEGVFSRIVLDGDLDRAWVYRYRVLRRHIDQDKPIFQMNCWLLWNCTSITRDYMEFELRNPLDGNNFYIPARQYMPPEFPTVTFK